MSTGPEPASAELNLACEVIEEDCFDGLDDDGDGFADCDDPACAALQQCQVCLPIPEALCDTSIDMSEDLEWITDAVDEGCGGVTLAPELSYRWSAEVESVVTLSGDDDVVFHVYKEADEPCQNTSCVSGGPSPHTFVAQAFEIFHIVVDSAASSPEGTLTLSCLALSEACANGVDDDNDGLTDCEDLGDCKLFPGCPILEVCDDGIDNDEDGYSDCKDIACVGHVSCEDQEICDDEVDNDTDGFTDCEDNLCADALPCQPLDTP